MTHNILQAAKVRKNDEFYTDYYSIKPELSLYRRFFRDRIVFLNCDDPEHSQFVDLFKHEFKVWKLKEVWAMGYTPKNTSQKKKERYWLRLIKHQNKRGFLEEKIPLTGDGDFRSDESIELLKEANVVVTNPPFSLFREYIQQLITHDKKFVVMGNQNAITYKNVYPLFLSHQIWLGSDVVYKEFKTDAKKVRLAFVVWFTNLKYNGHRNKKLETTMRYDPIYYYPFENYKAINVDRLKDIPCDYYGPMGVPITFFKYYNPEQFKILKAPKYRNQNARPKATLHIKDVVLGKGKYDRVLIQRIVK